MNKDGSTSPIKLNQVACVNKPDKGHPVIAFIFQKFRFVDDGALVIDWPLNAARLDISIEIYPITFSIFGSLSSFDHLSFGRFIYCSTKPTKLYSIIRIVLWIEYPKTYLLFSTFATLMPTTDLSSREMAPSNQLPSSIFKTARFYLISKLW